MQKEFEDAFKNLIKYEGGYVFDKDDKGAETFMGISRVFNPAWEGWVLIDKTKNIKGFPKNIKNLQTIIKLVKDFYYENFWILLKCYRMPPKIAGKIFEQAVNIGKHSTAIYLQRTLNILNRNEKYYDDIIADGIIGDITIQSLQKCITKNGIDLIIKILNILQGYHYVQLMEGNPVYQKYIGWFQRIQINKE